MDKNWILQLAEDIEERHGSEVRDKIFGDVDLVCDDHESISAWFDNFVIGMDELNDREFLSSMMAKHCPCRYTEAEEDIKKIFEETNTLEEFVARLDENGIFSDSVKLSGNVLYATKQPFSVYGKHNHSGRYSEKCHCDLASHTERPISDIFCHCCTVGYYEKMFKNALGVDVKVEFVDSVIKGGTGCAAAIYLPEK